MKMKGVEIFIVAVLIFVCMFSLSSGVITGEVITGDATRSVGLNISVTSFFPLIQIFSPKNNTYPFNRSIGLDFTVNTAQAVWYNLDGGTNTTITSSTKFNVSEGSHTLNLYANSTFGNVSATNVTFNVNLSIFKFNFEEYNGSKKGRSTNLHNLTYDDVQNLSGFILEHLNFGKINFNVPVNLTNDSNPDDYFIFLDNYTNISSNRIEINSDFLPNLNKPATLTLKGLTFTTPRILREGTVCDSSICSQNEYTSDGNLSFNVTGFTIYEAEETPEDELEEKTSTGATTTSKGGGSSFDFIVSPDSLYFKMKRGEYRSAIISIENNGTRSGDYFVKIDSWLEGTIDLEENSFYLFREESKKLNLDIFVEENAEIGIVIGKIIVSNSEVSKEIDVVLEIFDESILLNIESELKDSFLIIGQQLEPKIKIVNYGDEEAVDVLVEFFIRDFNGGEVKIGEERVDVESELEFERVFDLPENLELGKYLFYIRLTHDGKIATSVKKFVLGIDERITEGLDSYKSKYNIVILIAILLIIILILLRKSPKRKRKIRRV